MAARRPDGFDANMQVKAHLASSYRGDANDFLWRIDACTRHAECEALSFRAKVCVDLRMTIECDLKSIICSASGKEESCEDVHRIVRKCSHDIGKLRTEAKRRIAEINERLEDGVSVLICPDAQNTYSKITEIPIDYRYWVDVSLSDFSGKVKGSNQRRRRGTLIDDVFLDWSWFPEARSFAYELHVFSETMYSRYASRHTSHWGGEEAKSRDARFAKFHDGVFQK